MKSTRKEFLKLTGLAGIGLAGAGMFPGYAAHTPDEFKTRRALLNKQDAGEEELSIIGAYGKWAASLLEGKLPAFSLRTKKWRDLDAWREAARERLTERLAIPDMGGMPEVKIRKQYSYDGLHIEELSWNLPYGPPTEAVLLKPLGAKRPLPGILAFHDHSGIKYFGTPKITRTGENIHPMMKALQEQCYSGRAWANEMAKRGYVVLAADVFPFGSRRVLLEDVPEVILKLAPGNPDPIKDYDRWAKAHEHVMAKSLFSAGTTWPGVFIGEDRKALDILCAREDVDENRIGCGGLSGGGIRTTYLAGLDPRIKCAVCVGFQTTWKDLILNKSYTHTWMTYTPLLPNELEFSEILGLRAPLPTLILNNSEDQIFTLSEMEQAGEILGEVYKIAGTEDKYKCSFHPGLHKFDAKMQAEAFDWFDQWLKAC